MHTPDCHLGIFSGLNNLTDLTMQSDYATMLGYTQRELEENFVEEIEMAAIHLQLSTSLSITNKSVHWMQDRALASGF